MQKIIETLGGDPRQMLRELEKVVKEKTEDSKFDLLVEKDEQGRTRFRLEEKVKGEDDKQILEYLNADPKAKKELLKEIMKIKKTSLFE